MSPEHCLSLRFPSDRGGRESRRGERGTAELLHAQVGAAGGGTQSSRNLGVAS